MDDSDDRPSKFRLYSAILCVNAPSFAMGTCITWTSPNMPRLRNNLEGSPLGSKLTPAQEGWVYALISVGAGFSAYFAGRLADAYGRKPILMVASTFFVISYVVLACASHLAMLFIGRIFQGIGAGVSMAVVPMYSIELSTVESRGSVGAFMMLFMTLGQLYDLFLGPTTSYVVFQLACLIVPIISFVGYMYIPESPHYLIRKRRYEDAAIALLKIRGQNLKSILKELPLILEVIDRANEIAGQYSFDVIHHPGNRKALIIAIGLMFFQITCGAIVISINSQTIFAEANSSLQPPVCAIIVGIVQVLSSVSLQLIVNYWRRRMLLMISALVMGISQFAVGMVFLLDEIGDASSIRWLPLAALIVFQISYRLGFGPLPLTIAGELSAANIRAIVVSSATMTCWAFGFFISLFYPIVNQFGTYYVFFGFAIACVFAFLFVKFYVIETKGKTLKEITELLDK